jgi:hypothetical protein
MKNCLDPDPGSGMRKSLDPVPGSRIKLPGSATLVRCVVSFKILIIAGNVYRKRLTLV